MALTSHIQSVATGKASHINCEDSEHPGDRKGRLTDIIRTFRQHNRRLMERIVQCEKQREQETNIYKRKQSLKVMRGKMDNMQQLPVINMGKYHTIKTDREITPLGMAK